MTQQTFLAVREVRPHREQATTMSRDVDAPAATAAGRATHGATIRNERLRFPTPTGRRHSFRTVGKPRVPTTFWPLSGNGVRHAHLISQVGSANPRRRRDRHHRQRNTRRPRQFGDRGPPRRANSSRRTAGTGRRAVRFERDRRWPSSGVRLSGLGPPSLGSPARFHGRGDEFETGVDRVFHGVDGPQTQGFGQMFDGRIDTKGFEQILKFVVLFGNQ